ncbi:MAG: hypothetical protein AMS15_01330 [Planctomycetes bacterium DG_23]|nr:MAG: hypothetical protein AMS15_01330 [Planctomycetes bacterium DG_23]
MNKKVDLVMLVFIISCVTLAIIPVGAWALGAGETGERVKTIFLAQADLEKIEKEETEKKQTEKPEGDESRGDEELLGKRIVLPEEGFSIQPPKGWQKRPPIMAAKFIVTEEPKQGFAANVIITFQKSDPVNLKHQAEVEKLLNGLKLSYAKMFTDYKLLGSKIIKVGETEALQIFNQFTQGVFKIKNVQIFFYNRGNVYVVTGTALQSNFAAYEEIFLASAKSFRFEKVIPKAAEVEEEFTISPPQDWQIEKDFMGAKVFLYDLPKEGFSANINVAVGPSPGADLRDKAALQKLIDELKSLYPKMFTDYKFMGAEVVKIDEVDALRISGQFTQAAFKLKMVQWVIFSEGKQYMVTAGALESNFDEYLPIFEKCASTFRLKRHSQPDTE